eukprot:jgi/Chlat1/3401/Chrsp23S03740
MAGAAACGLSACGTGVVRGTSLASCSGVGRRQAAVPSGRALRPQHAAALRRPAPRVLRSSTVRCAKDSDSNGTAAEDITLDFDGQELLRQDVERYKARELQEKQRRPRYYQKEETQENSAFKDFIDKALVADFFFICLALLWLLVGWVQRTTVGDSPLLATWFSLWDPLFQPAIGALMLGALVSGLSGRKKQE